MAPRNGKSSKATSKQAPAKIPSSNKSRKRPRLERPSSSLPSFTSLASRKRRQPTCSMASLRNLENEETIEANFIGYFGASSDNQYTWGRTDAKPIVAIKRKGRRAPRFKTAAGNIPGLHGRFCLPDNTPEPVVPNSPDRSHILRLPLEIREMIYGQFLIYRKPIIVRYDWATVEHKFFCSHSIIQVCKQISEEASNFLYRQNTFRAILRPPPDSIVRNESFDIDRTFLCLFRNVIVECERDSWNLDWLEKASLSIEKLVEANAVLNSLTLVMFPQRVGMSHTAVGMEANPVTFADFFFSPGRFMTSLRKLRCRTLKIVVKKAGNKRFLISLDLGHMHASKVEEGLLANEETLKLGMKRLLRLKRSCWG